MAIVSFRYGGKSGTPLTLGTNEDLVVVRTASRAPLGQTGISTRAHGLLAQMSSQVRYAQAGVEVFGVRRGDLAMRDEARKVFTAEPGVAFAGRVLSDPALQGLDPSQKDSILYTENLFVKFSRGVKAGEAARLLSRYGLNVKRRIAYLPHAYFVQAPAGTGLRVFELANDLLMKESPVEFCHPELIRSRRHRKAFSAQWHLRKTTIGGVSIDAHASVQAAWKVARGKGTTIAVIDDGVDLDHEEFRTKGKIVTPRDASLDSHDPRPGPGDHHGTACAGVACADGVRGASGVAPAARLMPIRLANDLGSQQEADAFAWATDHGADVISCSWGPVDGDWSDPHDPRHQQVVPLPDNTRLAIEYALSRGRGGKGAVICWAAGNGNESVDNDGYASYPNVIAVAACSDTSIRSIYSDFGQAIWCAFPSSDFGDEATHHPAPKTPGIWTTDRSGKEGYNPGGSELRGDAKGNYTNRFGGTSSAAPGVAGVAALVISADPALGWTDVREILKQSCDRIDAADGNYDGDGRSPFYGYGRVNALSAVKLAAQGKSRAPRKRKKHR
jgi:subtilisin family serine protease